MTPFCRGERLKQGWLGECDASFKRDWTEDNLRAQAAGSEGFDVKGFVFVECSNEPPVEEAKWTLAMCQDPKSMIRAVTAHIPVPDGASAVKAFLSDLRDDSGSLPSALKGGRVVICGQPVDTCLKPAFIEGLEELGREGLLWEWCCFPEAIPSITEACEKFPQMTFVLDHLGHNNGGEDFDTWAPAVTELARRCPNVIVKLGASEEWKVADRGRFLDHAIQTFGFDRVIAESNWFVNEAMGEAYDHTFVLVRQSCERLGATREQIEAVFCGNACRVYGIDISALA